ncbi:MAG: hypothetical protein PVG07_09440, partial [Acidobacteriota bacterium]
MPFNESNRSQIVVAAGPRAAEETVFAWLAELLAGVAGVDRLELLAQPVRVVVPSRSLRLHLSAEIVRRRGAVAGVVVQTLHALAAEAVERAGEPASRHRDGGDALLEVLVRRFGRELPALAEGLEELADGYGAVAATVRDFLDAGLEPELADAVSEAAGSGGRPGGPSDESGRPVGTRAERERAEAVVRLADAVERSLRTMELGRASTLLRRAEELLAVRPELLPARAILVHGFADATGVATELLETLLRGRNATLILDRPPVPTADGAPPGAPSENRASETRTSAAREEAFSRRFLERLSGVAEVVDAPAPAPGSGRFHTLAGPGADAEVRQVARRVRRLLDRAEDPPAPERIGVVVRMLSHDQPYGAAIRRHFGRLGIPLSGVGADGPLLPEGRRTRALTELLRRRDAVTTDRWLDARPDAAGSELFELRLALHTLGAARLRDVAALDPGRIM